MGLDDETDYVMRARMFTTDEGGMWQKWKAFKFPDGSVGDSYNVWREKRVDPGESFVRENGCEIWGNLEMKARDLEMYVDTKPPCKKVDAWAVWESETVRIARNLLKRAPVNSLLGVQGFNTSTH